MITDVLQRYGVAFLLTVAATWVRQLMGPLVGDGVPFGTYLISVLLTAWLVGTGPAVAALLLGILAAAHFIVPPANSILPHNPGDVMALFVYGIAGAVAITLFENSKRQHELTRGQLQKIESLSAELRSADRRKDEFLALLSHELRNPLAPIRSGVLLLGQSQLDEPRRSEVLQTIERQLEQLIRIVDDLLDVSRFVRGRINLDCKPVDLRELVETALEQARPEIDYGRHDLQVVLPVHPITVLGDRIRIVQIVTNLLTNAAKYTPREGTIQVRLFGQQQEAVLQVIDNGIGIPQDVQPSIFELFTRSPAATGRDQRGLGLGLPIAKQFAEMHEGRLEVFSEGAGRGSRFSLYLPLSTIKTPHPRSTPVRERLELPARLSPLPAAATRVLVVDDNKDAADTLATFLSLYDFDACTALDGPQALRRIEEFHPAVLLLDIGLPGMDGYEVARHLRADQSHDHLKIIAVTGWGADSDIEKSRGSGIDHHLVKPVDPEELLRLLQQPDANVSVGA